MRSGGSLATLGCERAEGGADDALVGPARTDDHGRGAIGAVERHELLDHARQRLDGEMQHHGRAGRGEVGKRLARRHGGGPPAGPSQHEGLRHLGQGQLALERSCRRGEGRNAGRQGIRNVKRIEAAKLLADGAVDREIAGMEPRHVLAFGDGPPRTRPMISSRLIGAVSTMRAPFGQRARMSRFTSEPA